MAAPPTHEQVDDNADDGITEEMPMMPSSASTSSTTQSPEVSSFSSTSESITSPSVGELSQSEVEESMGRARENSHAVNDPLQRSQGKKNPSVSFHESGQGAGERKRVAYYCNYCKKDITWITHIQCRTCVDFDLCVECFSVGAEMMPHENNHPYRVVFGLSFPIISPEWSGEEVTLFLEGLEMYGSENWVEVAEHVVTKSKEECLEHYNTFYLNLPNFLPEFENTDELVAMAKDKKGTSSTNKATEKNQVKDRSSSMRVDDHSSDGSFEMDIALSLLNLSGNKPKRMEFDIENDHEAEIKLAEMEFNETDTEEELEIRSKVLRNFSKRLDERQHHQDFILERDLLHPNPIEKDFTPEERTLCRRYDVFMRFLSREDHYELLMTIVEEHRTRKRLEETMEARGGGLESGGQMEAYMEEKRRLVAEKNTRMEGQCSQSLSSSKNSGINMPAAPSQSLSAVDLLSEAEKRLCHEIDLAPEYYLEMQEIMITQIFGGRITKRSDARSIFRKVEPSKVDYVYDMFVKKGVAPH